MTEQKTDEKTKRAPKGSIDDESTLLLRMDKDLRTEVRRAAKDEHLSEAEWLRQAARAALPLRKEGASPPKKKGRS